MQWAHFLHIYQPPRQQKDILERVVKESYRPLVESLRAIPSAKIVLNINGALTELLAKNGWNDVIDGLRFLAERGQVEFTGSAKYHALLPLVPENEIRHQIEINTETNRAFFGSVYQPIGFFPPEMAYSDTVAKIVDSLGFQWMILDEIAYAGKHNACDYTAFHTIRGTNLAAVFRERRTSNLIMGAVVRSARSLGEALKDENKKNRYMLTGMDGETFGHHRPGHDKFLREVLSSKMFRPHTIMELLAIFPRGSEIQPHESTWSATEKELSEKTHFLSWKDPKNVIHGWQWQFLFFVLERVRNYSGKNREVARQKMDEALASDHFWWASAKPWWSLEMIELGAFQLLDALKSIPGISKEDMRHGKEYYERIVLKAFEWQRTGYIRDLSNKYYAQVRIPFKDRTAQEDKPYEAFIALIRQQMRKAVKRQEFEQAILWRDAIWKLETKNDIYDAMHIIDLLRLKIPNEEIEGIRKQYQKRYEKIAGGQPESRGIIA